MSAITAGYVPLTDALPLIAVKRLQLDRAHGFKLELQAMGSWAQVRDALLTGQVQAAHCLPGIPLAAQAGLYGDTGLAAAFTLNHFGNAITLDRRLFGEDIPDAAIGARLRELRDTAAERGRPLTFASVFPVSKHEFELRYWLRSFGVDPASDLKLVVIAPPLVTGALEAGRIDGFCVGEPWNSLALSSGLGRIAATSRALDLPGTEKVLAVQESWLHTPEHHALLASLHEACNWLRGRSNRETAADWLCELLDIDAGMARQGLLNLDALSESTSEGDFIVFSDINRPNIRHAAWLLDQILTQLHVPAPHPPEQLCQRSFRPDIYDAAIA